jgi:hypothetical protein
MHRMQENIVRPIRRLFANIGDPGVAESWISEPNTGLNNRTQVILVGNTLGGTSAINGAQFSRPEAKVRESFRSMPCCVRASL